jgi:hypothetical protein
MRFYVSDGQDYTLSPTASAVSLWDGAWHTVVGAYDGTSVSLWVDGAKVGETLADVTVGYGLPDSDDFFVGDYSGPCSQPLGFVGDIDGVAVIGRYAPADAGIVSP